MSMAVEAVDEAFEVGLPGLKSKLTIIERRLELASGVKTATLIFPKHIEHLGNARERIFGPGKDHISWSKCSKIIGLTVRRSEPCP